MKESALQKLVTDYLNLTPLVWWRVPLGGVMQQGGKFRTKNPMAGFPDLCGLTSDGRLWGIELKSTRGRVSAIQIEVLARLHGSGALIFIARSFEFAKIYIDQLVKI